MFIFNLAKCQPWHKQYTCRHHVPILPHRDIVDLMRKNENSFPHFRNSNTYKLFEPAIFENKKKASGYFF